MGEHERDTVAEAISRLAAAVEDHNRILARDVAMHEASHAEHDAASEAYERGQARNRAAWQVLYKRVVAPVVEQFMKSGGLDLLQSLFTGSGETEKPS